MSASSDEDTPLSAISNSKLRNGKPASAANGHLKRPHSDSELSDEPLAKRVKSEAPPTPRVPPSKSRKRKKPASSDADSDDGRPLALSSARVPIKGARTAAMVATSSRAGRRSTIKSYKEESDDEVGSSANGNFKQEESDHEPPSSDDDLPLAKKSNGAKTNGKANPSPRKRVKKEESDADVSVASQVQKRKHKPAAKRVKREVKVEFKDEVDSDGEPVATPKRVRTKKEPKEPKPKKPKEAEEEPVYKWWNEEDPEGDGSKKWDTLRHAGVLFPSPYEPLPSNVKMIYNGRPVDLPPESEEVAGFFAGMLETDHAKDATFQANFFKDWLEVLKEYPPRNAVKVATFEKCDFTPMAAHIEAERARVKRMSKAEKQAAKEKKEKDEAPYATCLFNGRPEKVGNFRIEPPGLFRGRGEHPKKGCLKKRVRPEDIVINIGEGEPVPVPNMPGTWKSVVNNNTVTWLAHWKENINGQCKYVFLAATSAIKGKSDRDKFEKARQLKDYVDTIRADYEADLKAKLTAARQRATAIYLIDKYALRAGNEKGEDEADTVGCCSLRCEHISLDKSGKVTFDFLGKDSIRYYKEIDDIHPQVFKNLRMFKGGDKKDVDTLFDRVTTSSLNTHLRGYMKGLTAKVFRTYNASTLFEQTLLSFKFSENALEQEKVNAYNAANKAAAELCNHQKAASKSHEANIAKMGSYATYLKHQRMIYARALFEEDSKLKKKYPELTEPQSDLEDENDVEDFEDRYYEEKTKEFEAAWERAKKNMEDSQAPEEEFNAKKDKHVEKMKKLKEEYDNWVENRGNKGWTLPKGNKSADTLLKLIKKTDEMISKSKLKREDKEALKSIALSTSKTNYLDPRITTAFSKRWNVPLEKLFNRSLRKKFPWALDVDADWRF